MTEEDYINLCVERAKEEARDVLDRYVKPFDMVEDYFCPNNMTEEEFKQILEDMKLPADQCKHVQT